ncbi:MAG: gliding motility-associated C-terminal domain-containing protein [Bacteroidetes bacterium]|nr:gliding motility-associated C-terminal domain-containing protein [Bacteroidota bacterium]
MQYISENLMPLKRHILLCLFAFAFLFLKAQNQNKKWYFGYNAALDFITNPPTILNNSAMHTNEGCSSIADAAGNLLFYTDGVTVWNQQHLIMANGTGLLGDASSSQSSIIVKQPGSPNLYYVFAMAVIGSTTGLTYSIVDMNLAAGMGSVTVKNISLNSGISSERLTATLHANDIDFWIMTHEGASDNYKAYLLTSAGVNTTAVVSAIGGFLSNSIVGCIKFSPNGQKFADARYNSASSTLLFDFNKITGVLSNSLSLGVYGYGCEFSPDGTKLYNARTNSGQITQWDLSAGSNSAILSSSFVVSSGVGGVSASSAQLAPNGKIYIAVANSFSIHVINNPNVAGAGCNFVALGQPVSAVVTLTNNSTYNSQSYIGLPNMLSGCTLSFLLQGNQIVCSNNDVINASIVNLQGNQGYVNYFWSNGSVTYTTQANNLGVGNWSVTLTDSIGCSSSSVITISTVSSSISFTVQSNDITGCNMTNTGSASITAVSGNLGTPAYSWNNGTVSYTTAQIGNLISAGNWSVTLTDSVTGCTSSSIITIQNLSAVLNVSISPSPALVCLNSTVNLTASGTGGGSTYTWLPSGSAGNQLLINASNLQNQTYTVIASLNSCTNAAVATVSVLPLPTAQIQVLEKGVCVNDSLVLKGSGGNSYTWFLPNGDNYFGETVRIKSLSGIYMLMVRDENLCANTATQNIILNPAPTGFIGANSFEGCVPLCNEYVFVPSSQTHSLTNIAWQIGNKNFSGNSINYCFNTVGTYTIQANIKDQNNCTNSLVAEVNVYPKPTADFTYSPKEPFEREEVTFINTSEGAKYFYWNFSIIDETSQEKKPKLTFENPDVYVAALIAQNDKLCSDTAIKTINIKTDFSIYVPNVFSPNGDNLNDVFKPVTRGTFEYRFFVFDYWGEKLFDTKDTNAGWDGTFKGEDCKVGIYVWKLVIVNSKEEKEFVGSVLLER